MKSERMNKEQKYIIIFSVIIFAFALTKYLIVPERLSVSFYMFELVSMTAVLLLVYFSDNVVRRMHKKLADKEAEIESLKRKNEQLNEELKERNSFLKKDEGRKAFSDIETMFDDLPSFSETDRFCNKVLSKIGENCEVVTGLFFVYNKQSQDFSVEGNYGIMKDEPVTPFNIGEGLHGEALKGREVTVLEELPEEYFSGYSGLGEAKPEYIYILPVADAGRAVGVLELASFKPLEIAGYWEQINKKLLEKISG